MTPTEPPETLCAAFQRNAVIAPDAVALRTAGDTQTLTWRDYADQVRRVAAGPGALLAAGAAGAVMVVVADPNEPGHYPTCPFLALTGRFCPGCGGMRCARALVTGDLPGAAGLNPLLVALLPVFAYLWVRWVVRAARGVPRASAASPWVIRALLGLILLFWVVRNLPFGAVLAP